MSTNTYSLRGRWNLKFNAGQARTAYTAMYNLNVLIDDTLRVIANPVPDVGTSQQRVAYEKSRQHQAHIALDAGFATAFRAIVGAAMPGARYTMRGVSYNEIKRTIESFRKIYAAFGVLSSAQVNDMQPIVIELITFACNAFVNEVGETMGITATWVECSRGGGGIDCAIM